MKVVEGLAWPGISEVRIGRLALGGSQCRAVLWDGQDTLADT